MTPLERALAELKAGRPMEAEAIVAEAVKQAESGKGKASPEYAAAEFDLGQVLLGVGDLPRAVEAVRRASQVPAEGPARRQQLTYLMNLGDILHRLGRLGEARGVHEQGLREREAFYGKDTEGYAFGQEPLAEVLLSQGELETAEGLADQALATLWDKGNRRAVALAALRAAVRAVRYGGDRPLLECFDALPDQLRVELVQACLERAHQDPPPASLEVLQELRERLEEELAPETAPALPPLVATISNVARLAQDHRARLEALGWLRDHFQKAGDLAQAVDAMQALALALDDAGEATKAEDAYRAAQEVCNGAPPLLRARVLRNRGLFLADRGQKEEADGLLSQAVSVAEGTGEKQPLGLVLVARGVFLQHQQRLEEAKVLLERALPLLPASHPDALCARSHLDAVREHRSCGCGELRGAVSKALQEMVAAHLPSGLLRSIEIESLEKLTLKIELTRPPTDAEREVLDRALHQAIAQIQQDLQKQGYAPRIQ